MQKQTKRSKKLTWQTLDYWMVKFPKKSKEECQKILDEKLLSRKIKHPNRIEYWLNKYPEKTLQECEEMCTYYKKCHNYNSVEYWLNKYPEKTLQECEEMRNNYVTECMNKRADNSGENNPAHHSKTTVQQRRERSVMCIEFWRKKFPDKTEEELHCLLNTKKKEIIEKVKKIERPNQIKYWLNRGFSEEEAKMKIRERQPTFTLEKCIQKYGEEEGVKRFTERQKKWQQSLKKSFEKYGDGRSSQSKFAKSLINQICEHLDLPTPKKERYLTDKNTGKHYAYDFCYRKKIIEFNGDYWHCNPKIYSEDFFNKIKRMYASEIWNYDKLKLQCAKNYNYDVLVIWEKDFRENPQRELTKCIKFIDEDY